MVVECHVCNINVDAIEHGSYRVDNPLEPLEGEIYKFLKCPKCKKPILTVQNPEFFADQIHLGTPRLLFPTGDFHLNPTIPEQLRKSLQESIQCYRGGANTATAIMCRRTIEGFCSLKDVKSGNLAESIKKLKETGIINKQLFEWANQLRLLGNEAAHNIDSTFTSTDARDILDFTIAILDFSYSFKQKFDDFIERRKNINNR
ncbi:DUF4145 domain-containing protein [Reichenbachiella versicolor]|uniref:DUF4145 domain-containing protein n=1 Tax=Reichenbachiella versicolor TaxID=1821036 RepID=UPI000D6E62AD|nr:DUF4145 domain-containing protein [Reichenbachiella versicolor]